MAIPGPARASERQRTRGGLCGVPSMSSFPQSSPPTLETSSPLLRRWPHRQPRAASRPLLANASSKMKFHHLHARGSASQHRAEDAASPANVAPSHLPWSGGHQAKPIATASFERAPKKGSSALHPTPRVSAWCEGTRDCAAASSHAALREGLKIITANAPPLKSFICPAGSSRQRALPRTHRSRSNTPPTTTTLSGVPPSLPPPPPPPTSTTEIATESCALASSPATVSPALTTSSPRPTTSAIPLETQCQGEGYREGAPSVKVFPLGASLCHRYGLVNGCPCCCCCGGGAGGDCCTFLAVYRCPHCKATPRSPLTAEDPTRCTTDADDTPGVLVFVVPTAALCCPTPSTAVGSQSPPAAGGEHPLPSCSTSPSALLRGASPRTQAYSTAVLPSRVVWVYQPAADLELPVGSPPMTTPPPPPPPHDAPEATKVSEKEWYHSANNVKDSGLTKSNEPEAMKMRVPNEPLHDAEALPFHEEPCVPAVSCPPSPPSMATLCTEPGSPPPLVAVLTREANHPTTEKSFTPDTEGFPASPPPEPQLQPPPHDDGLLALPAFHPFECEKTRKLLPSSDSTAADEEIGSRNGPTLSPHRENGTLSEFDAESGSGDRRADKESGSKDDAAMRTVVVRTATPPPSQGRPQNYATTTTKKREENHLQKKPKHSDLKKNKRTAEVFDPVTTTMDGEDGRASILLSNMERRDIFSFEGIRHEANGEAEDHDEDRCGSRSPAPLSFEGPLFDTPRDDNSSDVLSMRSSAAHFPLSPNQNPPSPNLQTTTTMKKKTKKKKTSGLATRFFASGDGMEELSPPSSSSCSGAAPASCSSSAWRSAVQSYYQRRRRPQRSRHGGATEERDTDASYTSSPLTFTPEWLSLFFCCGNRRRRQRRERQQELAGTMPEQEEAPHQGPTPQDAQSTCPFSMLPHSCSAPVPQQSVTPTTTITISTSVAAATEVDRTTEAEEEDNDEPLSWGSDKGVEGVEGHRPALEETALHRRRRRIALGTVPFLIAVGSPPPRVV